MNMNLPRRPDCLQAEAATELADCAPGAYRGQLASVN